MEEKNIHNDAVDDLHRKFKKRKATVLVLIALCYLIVVGAAAILLDDRRVEFSLNGGDVNVEYGESYREPGYTLRSVGNLFGEREVQPSVQVEGEVDSAKLGDYTLRYHAQGLIRSQDAERRVHVVDTTPPEITLEHVDGYRASWLEGYQEEGFRAVDAVDGDVTERVERTEVDDRVIYSVADSAGNVATVERKVDYAITEPVIKLEGGEDITVYATLSGFTDPGYEARDTGGNDLTQYVSIEGSVTAYAPGDYTLRYSITNDQGQSAAAMRTVHVIANPIPDTIMPEEKTIYLTFDDGPGPYTDQLLDVLAAYGAKATFFVTGRAPSNNDCIGRAYREGHAIGVHSWTHDYGLIYSSEQAFFDDFMKVEQLIYEQTGSYTSLFRFPGGSSNTVSRFNGGIMSRLASDMTALGYKYFDWNVSSGDAGETTSTYQVMQNVEDGCSQFTVSVVLQHDIKDFSVAAVEDILIWGQQNGYTFKALDLTAYGAHHGIAN